ncbi:MAG: SUMF1/EgtB/PvdO family nonheme iron enzyme [Pelodictyon phaeoclathratiforme]
MPDLYVAKYTVTNQHYRRFIDYLDAKEPESGIKGFSDWLNEKPSLISSFRSRYDDDKRFNKDDQPVVGVSWYAAKAWCLWLSLLEGEKKVCYRLPNEQEWEWAAGGQRDKRDTVLKVRDYPWPEEKGKPDKTRANYNNHEGGTTPVGRYSEGATPEGLYDMAGNVWEWTEDWYDEDKDRRSLCGGDYSDKADALRCSSRLNSSPRNWFNNNVGFRVIRSSHSSSS